MREAAKNLSDDTRATFPHFDWSGIIGLRKWTIVNRDLPPLVDELTVYLSSPQ